MTNARSHLTALFEHNPDLGAALLAAMVVLIALILFRKLYRTHIDSNGKILRTWRVSFKMPTRPALGTTKNSKKPYSPRQRKALRLLYAAQEAFFGLIVFGFGLVMFIAAMIDIGDTPRSLFQLLPAARCIVSILTMITGILLVYFRDVDNPFDDS